MQILQAVRSGTVQRFSELNQLHPCSVNHLLVLRPLATVGDVFELLREWYVGQGSAFGALFVMAEDQRVQTIYAGVHFAPEQMYFDFEATGLVEALVGKTLRYIHSREEDQGTSISFILGRLRQVLKPTEGDIEFLQKFEAVVSPASLRAYTISTYGCLKYYLPPVEVVSPHLPVAEKALFRMEVELLLKNLGAG